MVAFYQLYERYSSKLYGFILRYVKQKPDAEEIVQIVFIRIWESRKNIDVYSSFEPFLFTVAYNATMNVFRQRIREKKYMEHLKAIQHERETPKLIDEIHYHELNERVRDLLKTVSPRQKEVFQLSRDEGLTNKEIAQKLNITVNTVKKHITNTLQFLKKHLGDELVVSLLFVYLILQ